ncbi:MAG: SDR family oxidoreductase [Eudoraea sp.]|nr:SDR family oxidoreductase [Eudoraea sp.]
MGKKQKIAIVTGAGSGIGRVVARALSKADWTVVLAGRRQEQLAKTAAHCKGEILIVATDITNPESVTHLFLETKKAFGRLDLLFNNAGVGAPAKPLEKISREEWNRVIDTNISGAFWCTQEAFKIMKHQTPMGGRIINNGSISAHVPRPLSAPYTVSKNAVTGLTRSSSLDGREFNIACGQIDIGNAASEMTKKIEKGILQADGSVKIEPTIPVEEVAKAVLYMAGLPLSANVPFMTVMANRMPYIGRG